MEKEQEDLEAQELKELRRQIEVKDAYLKLMLEIAIDHDGFTSARELGGLIDELADYMEKAIDSDDKWAVYEDVHGNRINILGKKLEEE